ncbi:MAG TPA: glycosyltransferase family 2 protein [Polyangiaceae bacterium]|jgi:glycosyltransferase involved in cell wall biosynthesis|nr:glycosyltransferase family 2 protein [Polyangiaceae bacterium]
MSEPSLEVSIVVPVYNEEESVTHLVEEVHAALDPTGKSYELVLVDDGSSDGTWPLLERLADRDPALNLVRFRRNFGQTAAMQAGLDAARGNKIVTMDADLQNDPADIPLLLSKLDEGYDLVAGWRKYRKDPFLNRKLPSMLANRLISLATKVKLHDYGCTLKAMTSEVGKELRLYGEMHRFIPAVASEVGARILEIPVNHRARRFGSSKYGIGRTLRVVLDLITVRFIQSYLTRPMQVFGLAGLFSLFAGFALCTWLALEKLAFHARLADRPLLLLGVLLIVVGLQLLSLGLVADVVSRTYHESQNKRPYYVRSRKVGAGSASGVSLPPPPPVRAAHGVSESS